MVVTKHEEIAISVLVTPPICPPIKATPLHREDYPELLDLGLADYQGECGDFLTVDVLIGNDYYGQLVTGEMIKYDDHSLIAMNSKVGWLVSGPLSPDTTHLRSDAACHMVDIGTPSAKELNGLLPKLWELDRAGSSDHDPDTDQVLREFTNTIEYNDSTGRYVVRFPWRENKYKLPSNFGLSHNRLISLQRSLEKRDPELMVKYDQHIQDQLQLEFIEKVRLAVSHRRFTLYPAPARIQTRQHHHQDADSIWCLGSEVWQFS